MFSRMNTLCRALWSCLVLFPYQAVLTVMCNSKGIKKQPWGAPMLRMRVDEVCPPALTTWGLPVRKSRIHMHSEVFNPRSLSFVMSLEGTMVLNAEL